MQAYTGTMWTYPQYMMTVTIFSIVLSAGYVLFMRLLRCDASKIADLDLTIFGDPNMPINRYQKSVLGCVIVFIVGSIIISFGGMLDNPVSLFLRKIGVMAG